MIIHILESLEELEETFMKNYINNISWGGGGGNKTFRFIR